LAPPLVSRAIVVLSDMRWAWAAVRTGAAVPAGAATSTWAHPVPTPRTRAIGRSNNRRLGVSDMAALLVRAQLSTTLENGLTGRL